jgi:hypothetical protein
MLGAIFVILLLMWLLAVVTAHTLGGFIHVLLVVAIGIAFVRMIRGTGPVLE